MISSNEIRPFKVKPPVRLSIENRRQKTVLRFELPKVSWGALESPIRAILVGILAFGAIVPVLEAILVSQRYDIKNSVRQIVAEPAVNLREKLKVDEKTGAVTYNGAGTSGTSDPSIRTAGGNYVAEMPKEASKGVTVTDPQTNLSVKLIPQFPVMDGRLIDGNMVYPVTSNRTQLIYTVMGNGLKEDIILNRYIGDKVDFSYKLELPSGLEAKLLENGSLGVYSADPVLYGQVSVAGEEDKALLEGARSNGEKNHLAFILPAPRIIQSPDGKQGKPVSRFSYEKGILTVHSENLKSAAYPLSIDPSFVVTSANNFARGNNEGMIEYDDASGSVKRGGLTGGYIGDWSLVNYASPMNNRWGHATIAHNGYLYVLGGCGPSDATCDTPKNDVLYAQINSSDGSLGAWNTTASFSTARWGHEAVIYNGYLYVIGGAVTQTVDIVNDVQYAKISSQGSLENSGACTPWCTITSPLTNARWLHQALTYNGHLYVIGGAANSGGSSSALNNVEIAQFRGDGSLGTFSVSPSTFPVGRWAFGAAIYNGYLYITGGYDGSFNRGDVRYVQIKSDGTLGSWSAGTTLPEERVDHGMDAYNGYLYIAGGNNNTGVVNTVIQIQLNADGSMGGSWNNTTTLNHSRRASPLVIHNGYLYMVSGCFEHAVQCFNFRATQEVSKISAPGTMSTSATVSAFTNARWGHSTLVRGGRIHIWGGCTESHQLSNSCVTPLDIGSTTGGTNGYMTAPINADGTLGAWTSPAVACINSLNVNTSCPAARFGHAGAYIPASGRYVFVSGATGGVTDTFTTDVWSTAFDSSGVASALKLYTNSDLNTVGVSTFQPRVWATAYGDDLSVTVVGGGEVTGTTATPTNTVLTNFFVSGSAMDGWKQVTVTGSFTARWKQSIGVYHAKGTTYVYQIGGLDGSGNIINNIQMGATGNGAIHFTTACSPCSGLTARYGASAFVWKDKLIVAGGTSSGSSPPGSYLTDISQATISANGTISGFTQAGTLSTGRYVAGIGATNFGDYMYVAGGLANTGVGGSIASQSGVEHFKFGNGGTGSPGSWTTGSTTFTTPRYKFGFAQLGKCLYVMGGETNNSGTSTNTVQIGVIGDDYNITWSASSVNLQHFSSQMAAAAVSDGAGGGWLYHIGGNRSGTAENRVFRARIASDCTLSSTGGVEFDNTGRDITPSSGSGVMLAGAAVGYAGSTPYIYVLGGRTSTSDQNTLRDAQRASVNVSDGSLSTWTLQANYLPATSGTGLRGVAATTYQSQILTYGGVTFDLSNNDHYWRQLRANSINQSTGALTAGISFSAGNFVNGTLLAENGYLYLTGGLISLSNLGGNNLAVLHSDGASGEFYGFQNSPTGRAYGAAAIYKGRIYSIGGCTSLTNDSCASNANIINTWQSASLSSIARTGRYSRMVDFDVDVSPTKMMFQGAAGGSGSLVSLIYRRSTASSPAFSGETSLSPLPFSSLQNIATDSTKLQRAYLFNFSFDDSQSAAFPDTVQSSLSELEVFYRPNPGRRLRGGKTFTGQEQRGLDAQPQ